MPTIDLEVIPAPPGLEPGPDAAQLAQISMGFVDTVMAGHLSPQDLAAVAVAASLWVPILIFGMEFLFYLRFTLKLRK